MFAETRDTYKLFMHEWIANRLLDISVMLYAQQNGQKAQEFEKNYRSSLPEISKLIDPYIKLHEQQRKKQEALRKDSDEQKKAFMADVENKEFSTVEDIMAAVTGIRGTLVEVQRSAEQKLGR